MDGSRDHPGDWRRPVPRRRARDRLAERLEDRLLEALRAGDPHGCDAIIEEAIAAGLSVPAVHTRLIEPAMRSIGDLWEHASVTVAEEHLATAICHELAARLFARALRGKSQGKGSVMLAAVQAEHHVLGLRLAGDVLEGAGFDVRYLGPDVPLPALVDACRVHQPDVLGLTVSMWLNVPTMIWEIDAVARLEQAPRVMVGAGR